MSEELRKEQAELLAAFPNTVRFMACTDEELHFYYEGLLGSGKEYYLSIYDLDELSWLNTLLGYQLSWEDGLALNHECWELNNEVSVMELMESDKDLVIEAAKNAGLQIDFSKWGSKVPDIVNCFGM